MVLVVDIDGTIIFSELLENGKYKTHGHDRQLVALINKLFEEGHTIILHTARHWNKFQDTRIHLAKIRIKYHSLVMGKPTADFYIDDRGITPDDFLKLMKGGKKNVK